MGKYLTVDEQATYIEVACDGYDFRVLFGSPSEYRDVFIYYDGTITGALQYRVGVSGSYTLNYDANKTATLLENTSTRVVIKMEGTFDATSGAGSNYLNDGTQDVKGIVYFYVYPNFFVSDFRFDQAQDVTLDNNIDMNYQPHYDTDVARVTNETNIYGTVTETSGSTDYDVTAQNYAGFRSDELNVVSITLYENNDGGAGYVRWLDSVGENQAGWNNGTISNNPRHVVLYSIDSARRENDMAIAGTPGEFADWDTDIDTNTVSVGTICKQSADSLRYYCHTEHTAGAGNEPPDTDYWWEYRMTLGDQLQDFDFWVNSSPNSQESGTHSLIVEGGSGSDYWDGTISWGGEATEGARDALYGSRVFATLSAWEADRDGNVADSVDEYANIFGPWTANDTAQVVFDGWSYTPDVYIRTIGNDAKSQDGLFGSNNCYVLENNSTITAISVSEVGHTISIDGIQIESSTNAASSAIFSNQGINFTISNCFFLESGDGGANGIWTAGNHDLVVTNCVFNGHDEALKVNAGTGTMDVFNCTVYGNNGGDGFEDDGGTSTVKNCISFNNVDDWDNINNLSTSASDDSDSGTIQPASWANEFKDYTTGDFRIKDHNSEIAGAGEDLESAEGFSTDITGRPRQSGNWSIGAFEINVDVLTTGSVVPDMVIPKQLSVDGCASDGARHLEMASDEIEYTVDTERIGHVDVIEDPPIQTGTVGSPTDHLLCHLKLDENAASPNLNDETANNADGTWSLLSDGSDRNTNTSGDSVQEIGRGRNLDNQNIAYIDMVVGSGTVHDNDYFQQGSLEIKFKPNFAYDVSSHTYIFDLYISGNDNIELYYNYNDDRFAAKAEGSNGAYYAYSDAYTSNESLQVETTILMSWSFTYNFILIAVNGEVKDFTALPSSPTSSQPSEFSVCCRHSRGYQGDLTIDYVKTFDAPLLPYGAYFTGNGAVDVDHAHEDILFYWDCTQDALQIGSGSMTTEGSYGAGGVFGGNCLINGGSDYNIISNSGHVDGAEGTFSAWVKVDAAALTSDRIFYAPYDGDNYIRINMDGDTLIAVYKAGGTTEYMAGSIDIKTGNNWHHLLLRWNSSTVELWVDDVLDVEDSVGGTWTGTITDINLMCAGAGSYEMPGNMDKVFISSKFGTPQIPVILGSGPIHAPIQGIE